MVGLNLVLGDQQTTTLGPSMLGLTSGAGGGLVPPTGYVFLTDSDGTYWTDQDGNYLVGAA